MKSNKIFVTMNATFKDEEKCRVAMKTIVEDAHAAYGVNAHFWCKSKDGKSLFVVEQYEDEKALRKAVMRFTSARIAFFSSIDVTNVSVYGNVSKMIKLMFAPLSPLYMDYYGGYSRNGTKTQEVGISNIERNRIYLALNATFKNEEQCKVAMEGIVKDAFAESGTNSHFWCRSKEGKSLFVLEQYEDEKALIEHILANPPSRSDFFESIEMVDVTVYGSVSDKINEMFVSIDPAYMSYYGGYSK